MHRGLFPLTWVCSELRDYRADTEPNSFSISRPGQARARLMLCTAAVPAPGWHGEENAIHSPVSAPLGASVHSDSVATSKDSKVLLRRSRERFCISTFNARGRTCALNQSVVKSGTGKLLLSVTNLHVLLTGDAAAFSRSVLIGGCADAFASDCPAHSIYLASRAENTASVNVAILVSAG